MSHRYSTALSHIVLAGTSIYCLKAYGSGDTMRFPVGTYGIIITNSLIGIWRWGNPDHGDKVDSPYKFTFFLQTIFALPFIVTEVWLLLSYKKEFALAHAVVSLIPLIQYISNKESKDTIDVILGVNVISLGTVSFIAEKYWGIAAAVSFCLNHFFLQKENDIIDIPPEDLYNYGMCFFAYFALRSLA